MLRCPRLQAAVDEALVGATGPKPAVHTVQLDMTSFASIRAAAEKINAQEQPIDVSSFLLIRTTLNSP